MAKIELDLSVPQARLLLKTLDGFGANPTLAAIYHDLRDQLDAHGAAVAATGPWRKVVTRNRDHVYHSETLECGHTRLLRQSQHWIEEWAERRRCAQCAHKGAVRRS